MTLTKRNIIEQAFNEIGLGTYAYDAQPEDLQDALARMNALFAEWALAGALTGYPSINVALADDLDNYSNLPADAVRAAITALAVEMAPSYGKVASPQTIKTANAGYKLLMRKAASGQIPRREMDTGAIPGGAGYKLKHRINLVDEGPGYI